MASQTSMPEVLGEDGELVDQGDVHVAEGVLEQLGELGLLGRRDRHDAVDQAGVELRDPLPALPHPGLRRPWAWSRRCTSCCPGRCARASTPRGSPRSALSPLHLLEDRHHQLLGRPRVGRRLEHHRRARLRCSAEVSRRVLDEAQVRQGLAQRGRNGDDREVEAGGVAQSSACGR